MALLTVKNIVKKHGDAFAVKESSFTISAMQRTAIAGSTGSGKTTLLKMIAGWIQPTAGSIYYQDEKILGPDEQLLPGNKGIGYLSQHFELRNNYVVADLLDIYNKQSNAAAAVVYDVCRIKHLLLRKTNELSGGEKQRIALAAVLVTNPNLLLLDEPFSNLDAVNKQIIKQVIDDICNALQVTIILVSHDAQDILSWANRVMVMQDGAIIQDGTPHEIYHQPVNLYTAGLFGLYNILPITFLGAVISDEQSTNSFLIRPEHIIVTDSSQTALKVIVQSVVFKGNYYIIQATIHEVQVFIQTSTSYYQQNDLLDIGFDTRFIHYVYK